MTYEPQESPGEPFGVAMGDLAAWHARLADRAAQRAQEGQKVASGYRSAANGRAGLLRLADQHDAVASSAAAEARFHAQAAELCSRYL